MVIVSAFHIVEHIAWITFPFPHTYTHTHRTCRKVLTWKESLTILYLHFHIFTLMFSLLCSTHVQSHALAVTRSPRLPHTHTNSCFIDNITYFLPTVIWLCNCLQSVSPGNSWASSALFSTPNKEPFLIGPSHPLSLFWHQSGFLFIGIHGSSE